MEGSASSVTDALTFLSAPPQEPVAQRTITTATAAYRHSGGGDFARSRLARILRRFREKVSRKDARMPSTPGKVDRERREMLQDMLVRMRDETYRRVREFRADQAQESEEVPGDEMDAAHSSADVETHAGLIAAAEEKLKSLDEALSQLERGRYGICMRCQQPIPVERLIAVPFALYCVKCQAKQTGSKTQSSEGGTIPPYDQQWTPPEEMEEPGERNYRLTGADEELSTHYDRPFGPEEPVEPKHGARKPASASGKKRKR
jgi:DnaK suppressor protein